MDRNLLLLLIGVMMSSCELTYEDNARLLVDGRIRSFESENLPQIPVAVYALGEFPVFPSTRTEIGLIGESKVKPEGTYQVITISPENNDNISLVFNEAGRSGFDGSWPTIELNGIKPLSLQHYKYEIPDMVIGRIVNSTVKINRISNVPDTLQYLIYFNSTVKKITMHPNGHEFNSWQMEQFGELLPSETIREIQIRGPKGDSIQVSYALINNGIVTQKDVKVNYNVESNGYEFTF